MKKKFNNILSIILPNKKINIFVLTIVIAGITCGSIFASIIGLNDQNQVIEKIKTFIDNINNNVLDSLIVFKNSISVNLVYTILIWILGMTIIGIIATIILLFSKSFIFGFSTASFIITYKYKGIILSALYVIFGECLNLIAILILTIYSITFTIKLFKLLFKKNQNNTEIKRFLKNYGLILLIVLIINLLSSLSETFLLPALIKLVIKLYI